jgi:Flp pilus assembly protein TadD
MAFSPIERPADAVREPPAPAPANRNRALIAREQRDLLCAMAYVALGVGDGHQAVTLLGLVLREAPDDAGVLRLLAYALVSTGNGGQALAALDRLDLLEPGQTPAALVLLRSQALRLAGRLDEGRAAFRAFVEARRAEESAR